MARSDDLTALPPAVAKVATVDANGEIWWRVGDAEQAVNAIADAGLVILGLDLRDYDHDGGFVEWPWNAYEPTGNGDVERARAVALAALARPEMTGNAVLVTW